MNALASVLVDGVIYSSYLFIIAVGLTLIYGVMKILNIAHGGFYALGAYVAATLVAAWFAAGYNAYLAFALLPLAAVLVGLVVGPTLERGLLRFMYGQDEVVLILVTYAVFLILEDAIKLVWGVESLSAYQPYGLLGNFELAGLPYTVYDALLVAVTIAIGIALAWALTRTRHGKLLSAVIHDREISAAMGVDVGRFYLVTFTIGTMLAALGGAMIAPKVSVIPAMGVEVIVLAFAVVVIGGLGSLAGAALGALIVGLVRSAAVHYVPEVEVFSVYLVMALVLVVRPQGLFAAPEARRI